MTILIHILLFFPKNARNLMNILICILLFFSEQLEEFDDHTNAYSIIFSRYFGKKCSGCLQSIPSNELVMRALGSVYHLQCFVCVVCGHQLQKGDQFVIKDGQLFCRLDFEKEYAMMQLSPKSEWYPSNFSPGKSKSACET